MIELDHNATTRPAPEVVEAVRRALEETWHNPSSVHRAGQAARHAVELARKSMAELIGARPREITFTSGGTESIDLAIRGALGALGGTAGPGRTLITTRVEHSAVREIGEELAKQGLARWAPLGEGGVVDVGALHAMLDDRVRVVSVQWANNETGVVQPVREIARLCRERGVVFHCDATQWVGKEPASVLDEGGADAWCDLMSFSAHKFHGPKGVGVLWARGGVRLRPMLLGAQELGRRGGTENVAGIVGAGVAAMLARTWLLEERARRELAMVRDRFEALVLGRVRDAVVNRPRHGERLWNTSNIAFPGLEAEALLLLLSERGVNASAGAACSSGSLEPSPVLLAMGIPERLAHGSVRFSLSRESTLAEVEYAAEIVGECVEKLRESSGSLGA